MSLRSPGRGPTPRLGDSAAQSYPIVQLGAPRASPLGGELTPWGSARRRTTDQRIALVRKPPHPSVLGPWGQPITARRRSRVPGCALHADRSSIPPMARSRNRKRRASRRICSMFRGSPVRAAVLPEASPMHRGEGVHFAPPLDTEKICLVSRPSDSKQSSEAKEAGICHRQGKRRAP